MESALELWGGVECTVNRVGDTYIDQIEMSGHEERPSDFDLFKTLGIKTLRFPVLWERLAQQSSSSQPNGSDWRLLDMRLGKVRDLGMKVIVGFVHHGSGPRFTNLLDPEFAKKLALFARAFAARYPWIDSYTPINEPLTTARFSGLYGIWYPHAHSDRDFLRILFHECQAIKSAMEAVRDFNPDARLVQTEDMGRVFSTPFLSYQANFENDRRWLPFDLLMGQVRPGHPLWSYCVSHGLKPLELDAFAATPCSPQVIGINHYITSNRFLDERIERYPTNVHGGNGRHRYADIEAVRVGAENLAGPREILQEVWERYRIPMAVTEAHIGCTRDEQLRWFHEIWNAARQLRQEGVDLRAVTAWSLLGAFGWDSLVTSPQGRYEPGVYDLRAVSPRPTALAAMLASLSQEKSYDHPVLDRPGWWHRPHRLLYPSVSLNIQTKSVDTDSDPGLLVQKPTVWGMKPRMVLITGGKGTLATGFAFICERRGLDFRTLGRGDLDIINPQAVRSLVRQLRPWAVINTAGYGQVDLAEFDKKSCYLSNVLGPQVLASVCREERIKLLTFSSDLVFDGQKLDPYAESSPVAPLSVYGRSKAEGESAVLSRMPEALIVRTSAFFGPWDERNFLTLTLRKLAQGREINICEQQTVSPTYIPDLIDASLDLLIDGERGLWHLTNSGIVNWVEFARWGAERFGLNQQLIIPVSHEEKGWLARRPRNSALRSERGQLLPALGPAIDRYMHECRVTIL